MFTDLARTLTLFIGYLALEAHDHKVYVSKRTAGFHIFVYKVERELQAIFPELGVIHFQRAGAFPYSEELVDALWRMYQSGYFHEWNDHYRYAWHHDSEVVIIEELRAFWVGDEERKKAFISLAEKFREVVKTEEEFREHSARATWNE